MRVVHSLQRIYMFHTFYMFSQLHNLINIRRLGWAHTVPAKRYSPIATRYDSGFHISRNATPPMGYNHITKVRTSNLKVNRTCY